MSNLAENSLEFFLRAVNNVFCVDNCPKTIKRVKALRRYGVELEPVEKYDVRNFYLSDDSTIRINSVQMLVDLARDLNCRLIIEEQHRDDDYLPTILIYNDYLE